MKKCFGVEGLMLAAAALQEFFPHDCCLFPLFILEETEGQAVPCLGILRGGRRNPRKDLPRLGVVLKLQQQPPAL